MGGWVLKRPASDFLLSGFTMNICAVEGFAFIGIASDARDIFSRALASP